jgi:hypothetical protein
MLRCNKIHCMRIFPEVNRAARHRRREDGYRGSEAHFVLRNALKWSWPVCEPTYHGKTLDGMTSRLMRNRPWCRGNSPPD